MPSGTAHSCLNMWYNRKPQILSFWCILIKCLICLPGIVSKCLGVDITVSTYPQGTTKIRYGDPLEIFCVADKYSSEDIEFRSHNELIESERVNDTTRRLYIERPEKQLQTYYCRNKKTAKVCTNRVLVDSAPPDVSNFSCTSLNLDELICSWNRSYTYSFVKYNLTFKVNGDTVSPPRTAIISDNYYYCAWNTTSLPRYRQYQETLYLYMTYCNDFGCKDISFTIDHYSIVKPNPPMNLKTVAIGTNSAILRWKIPNSLVDFLTCGVEHMIEYQIRKIDNSSYFRRINTSLLPSRNSTYEFRLSNLRYAHMQYEVRVYIKSKKAVSRDLWSDFTSTIFYTASDRPRRPPDMVAGAFDHAIWDGKRIIYVYWRQLEEYEEAGVDFSYKVQITRANNTYVLFPNKNKGLGYVVLRDASLEALDVTVWSVNVNGSSLDSSHLHIPSEKDTRPLHVVSLTKLAYENGTYELSWNKIENVDNYTLFWCHHNVTKICSGRMDFAVLDFKTTRHIIDLPRQYKYQFAISANQGTRSSGMIWERCEISKEGFMHTFAAELKHDAPGKTYVHLRWSMDCVLQDNIITGYNIRYCPTLPTGSDCTETVENKYISDPKQTDVLIDGLLPFRTYQLTLYVNTIYGFKRIQNDMITTTEDAPSSPVNVQVNDIKSDSLVISWDPPLQKNGIIGKYVIYNYDKEYYVDKVSGTDVSSRQVTLTGLLGFTNYSFSIEACNMHIGLCSIRAPKDGVFVRTRVGPPSVLPAPTIEISPDVLKWVPPTVPGGPINKYEIKRVSDGEKIEILNTKDLFYYLNFCEGVVSIETYQVRAVNLDNFNDDVMGSENNPENNTKKEYPGEWSHPTMMGCKRL